MTLATPATVIPAQAGTHANFSARDVRGEALRRAARVILDADLALVATCVDPGLRRDDGGVGLAGRDRRRDDVGVGLVGRGLGRDDVRMLVALADHAAVMSRRCAARREAMR